MSEGVKVWVARGELQAVPHTHYRAFPREPQMATLNDDAGFIWTNDGTRSGWQGNVLPQFLREAVNVDPGSCRCFLLVECDDG